MFHGAEAWPNEMSVKLFEVWSRSLELCYSWQSSDETKFPPSGEREWVSAIGLEWIWWIQSYHCSFTCVIRFRIGGVCGDVEEVHWEKGRLCLSNGIVMKFLISEPSQSISKKPAQFWIEIYQLRQLRIGIVLQYQTQHWSTQDVDSKPQGPSCTMNRYNESYSFLALLCNEM